MSKKQMRKVAVIGTINFDSVVRADKSRSQGYGGILYNLTVLSQLIDRKTIIFPTMNVGSDHAGAIRTLLSALPQVSQNAVRTVPADNNHCHLRYRSISNKTEVLRGWVGGVTRGQLRKILDSKIILVNFISGSDISTRNLLWLRDNSRATIYMDFHSRTLGRRSDGTRFLRRPRDWRATVGCADILQLNDVEFRLLSRNEPNPDTCREFIQNHMAASAQGLLVTLGERGCLAAFRRGRAIEVKAIMTRPPRRVVDTTGCGDVFAGAFLAAHLAGRAFIDSARQAAQVATFRVSQNELKNIDFSSVRLR